MLIGGPWDGHVCDNLAICRGDELMVNGKDHYVGTGAKLEGNWTAVFAAMTSGEQEKREQVAVF